MRRFMLIVAALVFAMPALAVDVNAVKVGDANDVAITYEGGTDVRAFALNITVDNGATITGISGFFSGEGAGYGIFPGRFRDYITPADPCWDDPNYTPVAPSGDPGAGYDIPSADITIELGALYDGAPNQPPVDGNLCVLQIDAPNGDCNVCIEVNLDRGKVVMNDASEATTNLPICRNIVFEQPPPPPCFPAAYVQQYAAYNAYVANGWVPEIDSWCASPDGSGYQCHGDGDGVDSGFPYYYRIYTGDLNLVISNWKATAGVKPAGADPRADIDHKDSGFPYYYLIYTGDLNRVIGNWKDKSPPLPQDCPLTEAANNSYVDPTP